MQREAVDSSMDQLAVTAEAAGGYAAVSSAFVEFPLSRLYGTGAHPKNDAHLRQRLSHCASMSYVRQAKAVKGRHDTAASPTGDVGRAGLRMIVVCLRNPSPSSKLRILGTTAVEINEDPEQMVASVAGGR